MLQPTLLDCRMQHRTTSDADKCLCYSQHSLTASDATVKHYKSLVDASCSQTLLAIAQTLICILCSLVLHRAVKLCWLQPTRLQFDCRMQHKTTNDADKCRAVCYSHLSAQCLTAAVLAIQHKTTNDADKCLCSQTVLYSQHSLTAGCNMRLQAMQRSVLCYSQHCLTDSMQHKTTIDADKCLCYLANTV